jgi:putative oxidoreductase
MMKSLSNYSDLALLVGRVGLGIMYIFHGWPKLAGGQVVWTRIGHAMGTIGIHFFPQFWGLFAALAEFGGGILLILGLFFRPAALFIAFTMFIGFLSMSRVNHSFVDYSRPLEMCLVFIILLFVGPGKFSVDKDS